MVTIFRTAAGPLRSKLSPRALALMLVAFGARERSAHAEPTAASIVEKVLDNDAWGSSGALVKAHIVVRPSSGAPREMRFTSKSRRAGPRIAKTLLRFTAPADLAGQAFLQIEKADGDDERYLWIPELKKVKRIAGASRNASFSGTDFTYADMDRRDLREGTAKMLGSEKLGTSDCVRIEVTPKGESPYARLELWVRSTDNVPLKTVAFGKNGRPLKTIETKEARKVQGKLFITRSLVTNHAEGRTTELVLDDVKPTNAIADDEFTSRALEKE